MSVNRVRSTSRTSLGLAAVLAFGLVQAPAVADAGRLRQGVSNVARRLGLPSRQARVARPAHPATAPGRRDFGLGLHGFARQYADDLHRYNGAFPDEALVLDANFKDALTGQVPYWDVDPAALAGGARVELIGDRAGSPFVTAAGKVRVYAHYLNKTGRAQLERELGAPTGHIAATMTSSFRSIILLPDDGPPFQLKFSGDESTPWGASKQLPDKQVRTSVRRGQLLKDNPMVVPEPSGLLVGGGKLGRSLNVIYRPLPRPVAEGDRLLTWHVLMSPEFRATPEGRAMFARHGGHEGWFKAEAAPKLAALLHDSMFESFAHFELHSQNVDLMVGKDGTVRQVLAKDLLDVMHDPGAEAASGRTPTDPVALRDGEWGDAGDSGNHDMNFQGLGGFYRAYFSQLGMDVTARRTNSRYAGLTTEGKFRGWVMDALYARVAGERDVAALARFPEFAAFADAGKRSADPYGALDGLRNAVIKDQLTRGFRGDPAAKAAFRQGGTVVSQNKGMARNYPRRAGQLEHGYIGASPVAVERKDGQVREFYFAFD